MTPCLAIIAVLASLPPKAPPGILWEVKTPLAWYVEYVGSDWLPVLACNIADWQTDPLYWEVVQDAAGKPAPVSELQACIDAAKATCTHGVESLTYTGGTTPSCTFKCFPAPPVPSKPPSQSQD